jgi:dTDP-4-amino-4,6-dideoxygalactose transaminase
MTIQIPLSDLRREPAPLRSQIKRAVTSVMNCGWFLLGEEGERFEHEWAQACQVDHAVGVGNGTDALHLALRAAGIGPGDEVILPALSSAFSALAVPMAGATTVFADIDPERYTLDPAAFEAAITPSTSAVIAVHLYGCPADMDPIVQIARKHHLLVVEDASQAHGAFYRGRPVGGLGDVAAFDFYPSQNLGAYGDAGAVVTSDVELADRVRMLRNGGQRRPMEHEFAGVNSRLDEIQAAVLRAKLPHLEEWNQARRRLAARYDLGLAESERLTLPMLPEDVEHVFHFYVVRTPVRDGLASYLAGAGVETGIHYPLATYSQRAFAGLDHRQGPCPVAEATSKELLTLPLFPQLTAREVDQVIRLVRFFFAMRS